MSISNSEIAGILNRVADLLEMKGENLFRIRAYQTAARIIADYTQNIADMCKAGWELTEIPGVGESIAHKIEEIINTGTLAQLKQLEAEIPAGLSELIGISQLGPQRIRALHEALGITNLAELAQAAREGKIREVKGFGIKSEQKLLKEIEQLQAGKKSRRFKLNRAEEIIRPLLAYLNEFKEAQRIEVAGSYRRRTETVGDVDILATISDGVEPFAIMKYFAAYPECERLISQGETRSTIVLRSGLQVDLRVVSEESYGAALYYFTGSKAHNVAVRKMAQKKELKINEYGVFKGVDRVAGRTEEEVLAQVGLPYIEPELRENRGEIEAGLAGTLPRLVTLEDIRGDLQSHTTATDGHFTLAQMARAARERGYEYLAITDHSKRVSVARGLDEQRLLAQLKEIERLNAALTDFRILKSCEVDILEDGRLDLPDHVLKELDVVICSIHYHRLLPAARQTDRILKAMDNPYFNIMAHPTGRLIGERPPYEFDLERVMREAKARGIYLEINAYPDRLDLADIHIRQAKELGVKLAISTDAHAVSNFEFMRYGVAQARRGWLTKDDVLNTRSWPKLKKLLKRI